MRKLILAAIVCAGVLPVRAHAQLAVHDNLTFLQVLKSYYQEVQSYLTQVQQLAQEIQTATGIAQEVASTIENPSLGTVMGLMNILGIDNPLPVNPYAIMGLTSGYGGVGAFGFLSKLSGLTSLVSTTQQVDHLYDCTNNTFTCNQINQSEASASGVKGVVGKLYQDLASHLDIVKGLQNDLNDAGTTDPAQREKIIAELSAENTYTNTVDGEIQAASAMGNAQQQVFVNRENEKLHHDIQAVIAAVPN